MNPNTTVNRKTIIAHWRLHAAFPLAMYATRQAIIDTKDSDTKQARALSDFVLYQRNLRGLEIIAGVSVTTVVNAQGLVIKSAPETMERKHLSIENSLP